MAAPTPTFRRLGINLDGVTDSSADFLFANALKHARSFAAVGAPYSYDAGVALDAIGWPMDDFSSIFVSGPREYAHGSWLLRFAGQATIAFPDSSAAISGQVYDGPSNTTTVHFTLPQTSLPELCRVQATNTRRHPGDTAPTGLTDIAIMRPVAPGSSTYHDPGETFTRPILGMVAPFHHVRNLNLQEANGPDGPDHQVLTWSQRRLPTDPTQAGPRARGVAIELQIMLANADPLGIKPDQDLWFNFPDVADDQFVINTYLCCLYGSDGTNPYTGPAGSGGSNPVPAGGPAYPPLNGKLYVEWSNEITFNGAYGFPQYARNLNLAYAQVDAARPALTDLNWDGTYDINILLLRRVGQQIKRLSDLGRRVFGASAFGVKFVPVLMGQAGNTGKIQGALDYLINAVGAANVKEVICGGGCDWYCGMGTQVYDGSISVDQVVGTGPLANPSIADHAALLAELGLWFAGYEGGLDFGDNIVTERTREVLVDPRFGRQARQVLDAAFLGGASVLTVYGTTIGSWALDPCSYQLVPRCQKFAQTAAAPAAWAQNVANGSSSDPLPPLAIVTGVAVSGPSGPIAAGSTLTVAGGTTLALTGIGTGTNAPITTVGYLSGASGFAGGGLLTIPPAATAPQIFAVAVFSTIAPNISTVFEVIVPSAVLAPPPILDPSFETLALPTGTNHANALFPAGLPWTFGGYGSCGVAGAADDFADGQGTPFGKQLAILGQTAQIGQTITGWIAGYYSIGLAACQRLAGSSAQTISIRVDGVVVGSFQPQPKGGWSSYSTPTFQVAAGTHTIAFVGTGSSTDCALLDNVGLRLVGPLLPPPTSGAARLVRRLRRVG